MARLNTSDELFDALTDVGVIRDVATPNTSTVGAAATAGDTDFDVASGEGSQFEAGDLIRVGSGEELEVVEVASISTDTLTIFPALVYDHAVGETVAEQEKVYVGHVAEGGLTVENTEDTFEVRAATSAVVLLTKTTGINMRITWPNILFSTENIAMAMGVKESEITGTGTASDPETISWHSDVLGGEINASLFAEGTREDGQIIELRGFNVRWDLNVSSTLARNAVAELPTGGEVKTVQIQQWS